MADIPTAAEIHSTAKKEEEGLADSVKQNWLDTTPKEAGEGRGSRHGEKNTKFSPPPAGGIRGSKKKTRKM